MLCSPEIEPQIGTITAVGGGVIERYSAFGPSFTWTDGTPTGSVSQTLTGIYVAGANKGIQFTVPADQATRTLYVHVEAWRAQGKFEATLSDGSAAAFVDTSLNNTGGGSLTGIYVVQYKAAAAGQTLTVQWTTTAVHESGGNVSLRGVALTTGQGGGGGSSGATYQDLTYTFDAGGNLDALTDPLHGNLALSYDALNRLTQATGPYGTSGATASITYEYDAIGNLTKNTQLSSTAYTYPASGSSSVRPHAVSTAGGHTYSYDNNGNVTSGAGRTYTWNPENKPLTITQGGTTTFVYGGDGGRVKKVVGSTMTRYISKLYECETTGAGTTCTRYIWAGDTRIATVAVNTGTVYYWHPDHLGSSTVITDSMGVQVQAVAYYPYGATRTNESPSQPPVDVRTNTRARNSMPVPGSTTMGPDCMIRCSAASSAPIRLCPIPEIRKISIAIPMRGIVYPQCILVTAHTQDRLWSWVSMKDFMLNKVRSGGHSSAHCGG